jgi:hypothetical protein
MTENAQNLRHKKSYLVIEIATTIGNLFADFLLLFERSIESLEFCKFVTNLFCKNVERIFFK